MVATEEAVARERERRRANLDADAVEQLGRMERDRNVTVIAIPDGSEEHHDNDFFALRCPVTPPNVTNRVRVCIDKAFDKTRDICIRMPPEYADLFRNSEEAEEALETIKRTACLAVGEAKVFLNPKAEPLVFVRPDQRFEEFEHPEPAEILTAASTFCDIVLECTVPPVTISAAMLFEILTEYVRRDFVPRVIRYRCVYTGRRMRAIADDGQVKTEPAPDGACGVVADSDAGFFSLDDLENMRWNARALEVKRAYDDWRRDAGFYMNDPTVMARRPKITGVVLHEWNEVRRVEDVRDPHDTPEARARVLMVEKFRVDPSRHVQVLFCPEVRAVRTFCDTKSRREISRGCQNHHGLTYNHGIVALTRDHYENAEENYQVGMGFMTKAAR